MKKRILSSLLALCLCLSLVVAPVLAASTPAVSGSYSDGIVTVTGEGFPANTAYSMIAVKDSAGKLIALGSASADAAGAISATITTGTISEPNNCMVYLYNNIGGTVAASGAVSDAAPVTQHTIAASAGNGGTISPSGSVSVNDGASQTFTIAANAGYTISDVKVDGTSKGAISTFTFTNVTANHTIAATFASTGGGGGGGGGGGAPSNPSTDAGSASVTAKPITSGNTTTATVSEADMSKAVADAVKGDAKTATVVVKVDAPKSAVTVKAVLPVKALADLANGEKRADVVVESTVGSVTLSDAVLNTIADTATTGNVELTIAKADTSKLTSSQSALVGDRPVYDFTLVVGGKTLSNLGGDITVSLPYTLKDGENANDVVVWYISDAGELTAINATYNNGTVTFKTNHFSVYAIAAFPFKDVANDAWYYSSVAKAMTAGFMNGMEASKFAPQMTANRAMVVTMMYRIQGVATEGSSNFNDVDQSAYYADAVKWAVSKGIIKGLTDHEFGPNATITREQLAAILYRAAGEPTVVNSAATFNDASNISDYAKVAIAWCASEGILRGDDHKNVNPQGKATRAEIATMFSNYISTFGSV